MWLIFVKLYRSDKSVEDMDTMRHTDHEIYFIDEKCIDLSIQGTVYFMSLDTGSAYKILRAVVSSGISIGD